ncbi:MAG: DUF1444 family protein [Xanthomonadaceae bacterium]|jgi:uncharacterized protein YtpQ (UPF0354 family)|nr:DUF1444 family protein [Xanthomonadaceae bacterium]
MSLLASLLARWSGPGRTPIDPDAFTDRFADRLRIRLPAAGIEILAPLSLSITYDGDRGQLFLDNLFRRACAAADDLERADIVERHLAALVESKAGAGAGAEDIVPVLKSDARSLGLPESDHEDQPRHRIEPLVAGLSIVYAVDSADTITFVPESWFAERGIPAEGLRRQAVDNLRGKLPRLDVQRGGGLNMVMAGGHYESSLLLFDDFWVGEAARLRGDPVIAVPARDVLLFADTAHARALVELQQQAQAVHADAAYALTPRLFRRSVDGHLALFDR